MYCVHSVGEEYGISTLLKRGKGTATMKYSYYTDFDVNFIHIVSL